MNSKEMKEVLNWIVKDSAMIISNSETVLKKPCMLHDDFKVNFMDGVIPELYKSKPELWRLKIIAYHEEPKYVYLMGCTFEYTDNKGEIYVEYIKTNE